MWLTLHHRKSTVDVEKTVQRMVDRFLSTAEVVPSQKKNGPEHELTEFEEMIIIQQVYENPSVYLHKLQ